jgi:hypothetical protein
MFSRAKHIMGQITKFALRYAKVNLGVKKVSAPLKIPRNAPSYVLPQTKKNLQDFQDQRYIGIFTSLRERKREREIERKRERERNREREKERERERE